MSKLRKNLQFRFDKIFHEIVVYDPETRMPAWVPEGIIIFGIERHSLSGPRQIRAEVLDNCFPTKEGIFLNIHLKV